MPGFFFFYFYISSGLVNIFVRMPPCFLKATREDPDLAFRKQMRCKHSFCKESFLCPLGTQIAAAASVKKIKQTGICGTDPDAEAHRQESSEPTAQAGRGHAPAVSLRTGGAWQSPRRPCCSSLGRGR